MQSTTLLYLEDFSLLEHDAQVVELLSENEKDILILDQTIFYPQGGGQPYDTGIIKGTSGTFTVEEVRFINGIVKHIGKWDGTLFQTGDTVRCFVEKKRRILNSRIHSAGHIIDMAVHALKLNWIPGKGYHFPDGPYVEYAGSMEGIEKEKLQADIERLSNDFIKEARVTKLLFMEKENMKEVCHHVPDYLPEGKPGRVVMYGDFGVPCGGTHVANLLDVGSLTVRKIKTKGSAIRVSYDVER